jgi:heme A synthase
MTSDTPFLRGIHSLAVLLAGYVVLLITAGGLVKSLEAGLSVPDWPLSYGMLNPPRWWEIETVRAEHGHRLIAGTVLLLTLWLMIWIVRREPRKWVKGVALTAFAAVLAQAVLGGITVLFFLPTAISVSHAALAQLFLCLLVVLAVATSRRWVSDRGATDPATRADRIQARFRHWHPLRPSAGRPGGGDTDLLDLGPDTAICQSGASSCHPDLSAGPHGPGPGHPRRIGGAHE